MEPSPATETTETSTSEELPVAVPVEKPKPKPPVECPVCSFPEGMECTRLTDAASDWKCPACGYVLGLIHAIAQHQSRSQRDAEADVGNRAERMLGKIKASFGGKWK